MFFVFNPFKDYFGVYKPAMLYLELTKVSKHTMNEIWKAGSIHPLGLRGAEAMMRNPLGNLDSNLVSVSDQTPEAYSKILLLMW